MKEVIVHLSVWFNPQLLELNQFVSLLLFNLLITIRLLDLCHHGHIQDAASAVEIYFRIIVCCFILC